MSQATISLPHAHPGSPHYKAKLEISSAGSENLLATPELIPQNPRSSLTQNSPVHSAEGKSLKLLKPSSNSKTMVSIY